MHGMIMVIYLLTALFLGGFGNYLIPLMCGARDMVFPYMNMLSYWVYLLAVIVLRRELLRARRADRRRLDAVSAAGDSAAARRASNWGIILMLVSLAIFIVGFTMGGLNYVDDRAAGALPRHDADAHAVVGLGHLHGDDPGLLAFPALFVSAIMMMLDSTLGTSFFMPAIMSMGEQPELRGRQPAAVPAPVLVLRPPRGLHRRPAGLRHRLRPDQHARATRTSSATG